MHLINSNHYEKETEMEKTRFFSGCIKAFLLFALTLVIFDGTGAFAQGNSVPAGPYGAVMEYDSSRLPYQTVYRPRDLTSAPAAKIPIVAWGNGGCAANGGVVARPFLMEIASYGYLIIAPGKPAADISDEDMVKIFGPQPEPGKVTPAGEVSAATAALAQQAAAAAAGSGPRPESSKSSDLIDGINWAIKENSRPGSIYFNRLDVSKIAVMGHSCGGLQSIDVAKDPRIVTTIVWNSGIFDDTSALRGVININKDALKELHSPIAYFQGGPTDIAYKNSLDDFERINNVPAFMGEYGVGHGGTFLKPNGGVYAKVALAWLNWQLKGDQTARAMFSGAKCGLCTEPYWTVRQKQME
jgi:hypothetical protein